MSPWHTPILHEHSNDFLFLTYINDFYTLVHLVDTFIESYYLVAYAIKKIRGIIYQMLSENQRKYSMISFFFFFFRFSFFLSFKMLNILFGKLSVLVS